MITPAEISEMTLDALRAARDMLDSTEWALEMDAAAPDIRRESGLVLGRVQGEILRLENLQLASIADALKANGAELTAAANAVKQEVKKIAKVAKVLKTVDQLLKLAIKVAPKALGLMGAVRRPAPPAASAVAGKSAARAKPKAKAAPKSKTKAKPKAKAKVKTKPKAKSPAKPKRKAGPGRRAR